jgi:hypothetical protein
MGLPAESNPESRNAYCPLKAFGVVAPPVPVPVPVLLLVAHPVNETIAASKRGASLAHLIYCSFSKRKRAEWKLPRRLLWSSVPSPLKANGMKVRNQRIHGRRAVNPILSFIK